MELFGYEFRRKDKEAAEKQLLAFAPEEKDDGALIVGAGGSSGIFVDMEGGAKTEAELITKYRNMYNLPECQMAVDKIVNEAIVQEEGKPICEINLDGLQTQPKIKDAIRREWKTVTELLRLNQQAYNIFMRWYVDGRIVYQKIIDENDPKAGLQELRYVDPRKIRKVRTTKARRVGRNVVIDPAEEFYIYNQLGFGSKRSSGDTSLSNTATGLKISAATVTQVTSGLVDGTNSMVLGWLNKAIKPLNMLTMLEDSTVIYRVSRSSEKRIFNVEVGQLPKAKAEQYVMDMMTKFKNRLVYDAASGEIRDDRKYQTMYEDMWFPKRGSVGTSVETLPGGQNLGVMDDVNYFRQKLFEAMNIPMSRMQESATPFNVGRSSEITRDELDFQKFIDRLRTRFSQLFIDILGTQLVLKGVLTQEDWFEFKDQITFEYARDNFYAELKNSEILSERIQLLSQVDEYDGKYFSRHWVQKNVLKMTDLEISQMEAEMKQEKALDGAAASSYQDFDTEQSPGNMDPNAPTVDANGNPVVAAQNPDPEPAPPQP